MSARGHGRLGAGVILQEAWSLRSSEPLGITGDDVMLPEDRAQEVLMPAVIGLGIKHGTKAKRARTMLFASNRLSFFEGAELFLHAVGPN